MTRRRPASDRQQERSPFTDLIEILLRWSPGVEAVVLIDRDGEAVDYAGGLPTFVSKIAAAHCGLLWAETVERLTPLGVVPDRLTIRCSKRGFVVSPLAEGYALAILLRRRAFSVSERALIHVGRALCQEAGWESRVPVLPTWVPIEVESERWRFRPLRVAVAGVWTSVDVLGSWHDSARRERGFRVRTRTGVELTLIREPPGCWFADEPVQALRALDPRDISPLALESDPQLSRAAPTGQTPSGALKMR